jgi:putative ABC transport system substrate-binding protein
MIKSTALRALLALGVISTALLAHAQSPPSVPRIGVLDPAPSETSPARLQGLRAGLKSRGLEEGRHYVIEYRSAEGKFERLPALAAELVKLPVKVLVARNTPGVHAARAATTRIPIVMADVGDPVGIGLIKSLAKPGGNITGLTNARIELLPKRLEYLHDAVPALRRLAVLANPDDQNMSFQVSELRGAAGTRGIELRIFEARNAAQLDTALEQMVAWKPQAVLPFVNPIRYSQRLIQWAAQRRVPVMFAYNTDPQAGGLMAYDADLSDHYQRVAIYVDKLLAGADPATLPVERPTRFELTLNLKTAKALGLKFPQSLLTRADRVVD